MSRGIRESQWLVIRRCLAIIRRVQRGPADWPELVQAVLQVEPEAYGLAEGRALQKRLYRDLDRIRQSLRIDLRADPRTKEYTIRDCDGPMFDLPDEHLLTMAWLEQTFQPHTPRHKEIHHFLRHLQFYLSSERRAQIEQSRLALVLELGQQDDDQLNPAVEEGLSLALANRWRVEFDYRTPQYADGQPRRHVADIYEPAYFDPERGHYYVRGWCRSITDSTGSTQVNDYLYYRLGRISNLQLLRVKLPFTPPPAKRFPVIYRLAADIARQGVTRRRWIDIEKIEVQTDESAMVYGTTESIFWAVQELMHYRHNCRVLGGPEMLREMQRTVQKMADLYRKAE